MGASRQRVTTAGLKLRPGTAGSRGKKGKGCPSFKIKDATSKHQPAAAGEDSPEADIKSKRWKNGHPWENSPCFYAEVINVPWRQWTGFFYFNGKFGIIPDVFPCASQKYSACFYVYHLLTTDWLYTESIHYIRSLSSEWMINPGMGSTCREWMNNGMFYEHLSCISSQVALVVKNPPANAGDIRDAGSILGWGRSPAGDHGKPL